MNIAISLETLGCDEDAVILQIGVAAFDVVPPKDKVYNSIETFSTNVRIQPQLDDGRTVSVDALNTVLFRSHDEIRNLMSIHRTVYLAQALISLERFYKDHCDERSNIWIDIGRDFLVLKHAMRCSDFIPFWSSHRVKDANTLFTLYEEIVAPKYYARPQLHSYDGPIAGNNAKELARECIYILNAFSSNSQ